MSKCQTVMTSVCKAFPILHRAFTSVQWVRGNSEPFCRDLRRAFMGTGRAPALTAQCGLGVGQPHKVVPCRRSESPGKLPGWCIWCSRDVDNSCVAATGLARRPSSSMCLRDPRGSAHLSSQQLLCLGLPLPSAK